MVHILFKVLAGTLYFLMGLVALLPSAMVDMIILGLAVADFWVVKNVTGRRLV